MIIKEALALTFLGMGIVFLVLAIDFFSILVIGMFREQERADSGMEPQGLEGEFEDQERALTPVERTAVKNQAFSSKTSESGKLPGQETAAAIIAAIHAWEVEEGQVI